MKKKTYDESSKKIKFYLIIEFLLVALISCPLFILDAKSADTIVFAVSVIFMWLPALAVLLTRKITKDKSDLLLKPLIKKNWKYYILAAFLPGVLIVFGAAAYFMIFPEQLDLSMGYIRELAASIGQTIDLPTLPTIMLLPIALVLIIAAPLVFVNHILAFGEEIGWRGYLTPLLCKKFGNIKGTLCGGALWGLAHAPLVCFGVNYSGDYPGAPFTGILMMVLFAATVGVLLTYLVNKTNSIIPSCIAHGAINAIREAPLFICLLGNNALLGPKPSGIIGMSGFLIIGIVLLVKTKKK